MFGQKPPQQTTGQEESDGPTTEQVLRIERLEAQIRQMTGTIEQLQYRNQQLENQLRGGRRRRSSRRSRRRSRPPVATAADGPACRSRPSPCRPHRRRRRRPRRDAAPTCSIRRRIPMRRACRARSAACRTSRRRSSRPSRRSARPAAAGPARRSICRRCRGRARASEARRAAGRQAVAAAAAAQSQRHRRGGRGRAAVGFAEGHLRPRLRLCAAQGLRAGRGHLPGLPEEISDRPPRRRRAILARREPVPAPAL